VFHFDILLAGVVNLANLVYLYLAVEYKSIGYQSRILAPLL